MSRLVIAILAHPDDESFGMGGTLALWSRQGMEVHVITATRGEAGGDPGIDKQREQEAKNAADALDLHNHHFLDYHDGKLSNDQYHDIAADITTTVDSIVGDRNDLEVDVLTFDRFGISGHLDHIAISMITTYYYRRVLSRMDSVSKSRLLYLVLSNKMRPAPKDEYFVYGPGGVDPDSIDIEVNVSEVIDMKRAAIKAHASQNPEAILKYGELLNREYFNIYDGN